MLASAMALEQVPLMWCSANSGSGLSGDGFNEGATLFLRFGQAQFFKMLGETIVHAGAVL